MKAKLNSLGKETPGGVIESSGRGAAVSGWADGNISKGKTPNQRRALPPGDDLPQRSCREDGSDVSPVPFPRWKRILDITVVVLSLPCWLPLMGLIALGIRFISPGPVLFCQERVGYRGRRFKCLKFRSMKVNVETQSHESHFERLVQTNSPMTKLDVAGDSRLIPWGRLLRATCLDELPQIFNVLRGEMSIVGPRPCTPKEFRLYESWQQERVDAPPGLTGYWQVHGKNRTTFNEMIEMDMHYARHMCIWLDIAIIFGTIPAIIGQVYGSTAKKSAASKTTSQQGETETREHCI